MWPCRISGPGYINRVERRQPTSFAGRTLRMNLIERCVETLVYFLDALREKVALICDVGGTNAETLECFYDLGDVLFVLCREGQTEIGVGFSAQTAEEHHRTFFSTGLSKIGCRLIVFPLVLESLPVNCYRTLSAGLAVVDAVDLW